MFWPRTANRRPATVITALFVQLTYLSVGLARPGIANTACPAALENTEQHRVETGETLASIAADYSLGTTTLAQFNPELNPSGSAPLAAGSEITIPPFNGRVVSVGNGESWQSLAERHGSRADVLFEVNGCVSEVPSQIFVPMANPISPVASRPTTLQLPGYPLANPANISRSYGWQPHNTRDELVFNSGMAFEIAEPTDVRAVGSGTVAFAGEREGYGQMVVINHEQGLQTRYANLSNISVSVGQPVTAETTVGKVGSSAPTFLYFEVRTNSSSGWIAQDPGKYLPALELR